jgi:hypothetical protein
MDTSRETLTIPAELSHPLMHEAMIRGVRYGHHMVVELISDGERLWAVASNEGRALIAAIEAEAKVTFANVEQKAVPDSGTKNDAGTQ